MKTKSILMLISLVIIFMFGCDAKNGKMLEVVELPTDYQLTLFGENEGIHPDTNVLNNPENPYADANVNMENVWELSDASPSAKARFYLWATLLAKIPTGEHQYFTAKSLHELYTVGGSENAKIQTKKAYRASLDFFFDSVTWWQADWLPEETYYAVLIRELVAQSMYDPSEMNLLPLYNDPAEALADLSEWGYVYDFENGTISKRI